MFTNVIANGKTTNGKKYGLVSKFAEIFNAENDNNEEAVFAIQSSMNTGNVNNSNAFDDLNYPYNTGADGPGNCCGFFQPSFSMANAYRTSNGLPLLGEQADGTPDYNLAANAVKNDFGINSSAAFTEDADPLDPRIDHTIGRRGIQYLDWIEHPGANWIRAQPYAGPYSPKKYIYYKRQENTLTDGSSWTRGYATMNFNIIRFADVLLMAAEAEIEGGSLATALGYINQVRSRAANPAGGGYLQAGLSAAANTQAQGALASAGYKNDFWSGLGNTISGLGSFGSTNTGGGVDMTGFQAPSQFVQPLPYNDLDSYSSIFGG
jgi:hypothetical protein